MDNSAVDFADRTLADDSEPARLMLYRSAVQKCLQDISSSIRIDEFHALFQRVSSFKKRSHVVNRFYNILTEYINQSVCQQVEEHIEEEALLKKFSDLEKLILENSSNKGKELWRPSHDVRKDLRSYVMQEKLAYKDRLERMVTAKEDVVNKLKYDIIATENRVKKLEQRIDVAGRSLDSLVDRTQDFLKDSVSVESHVSSLI